MKKKQPLRVWAVVCKSGLIHPWDGHAYIRTVKCWARHMSLCLTTEPCGPHKVVELREVVRTRHQHYYIESGPKKHGRWQFRCCCGKLMPKRGHGRARL